MDEQQYPSNSRKSKEKAEKKEKKVEKVASGEIKEKTGIQKFMENFISEDASSVRDYILSSIIIPQIKELISQIASRGVNWILYGDSKPRNSSTRSRVSYSSMYSSNDDTRDYEPRSSNKVYNTSEVLIQDRGEADLLLETMQDMLDEYGVVNVADFYDLAGIDTDGNYQMQKYGWTDLTGASVRPVRGGFIINLPKPRPINY